jgi:nickel-dependent lactate racemase
VIVVDDQTRVTPCSELLPETINQMVGAGIPANSITIIVGKGTHAWPSEADIKKKVGEDAFNRYKVTVHDPDDSSHLTLMGTTKMGTPVWINSTFAAADVKVAMGTCVGHYFAGYGGGPKIILPGVSGRQTIVKNHIHAGDASARLGQTAHNIIYHDMLEAARIAKLDLKIDVVLDMSNKIARIVCGEVGAAHAVAIKEYNDIYGFHAPHPADVTVVSGYPLESELLQSCKGIVAAAAVTKEGGEILVASEARNGAGPGFDALLKQKVEPDLIYQWIDEGKVLPTGGPIGAHMKAILAGKKVTVVTDKITPNDLAEMGIGYAPSLQAGVDEIARRVKAAEVIVLPAGSSINPT